MAIRPDDGNRQSDSLRNMKLILTAQLTLLLLRMDLVPLAAQKASSCADVDDEQSCRVAGEENGILTCGVHPELCSAAASSLYRHGGGSAQAYVPNAPVKDVVCQDHHHGGQRHKVATWSISRKARRVAAPKLHVGLQLWSCSSSDKEDCCCQEFSGQNTTKVEVWQARPDGTYSSLGKADGDCRATVVPNSQGKVELTTLAPGSTGGRGGVGPNGWDVAPYGPPVLHLLVTDDNHYPVLLHIPIVPQRKTLERGIFWGPDFRGHAIRRSTEADAYNITSWTPNVDTNSIQIEINVLLSQKATTSDDDLSKLLCPSFVYGMPSSFFSQPIAVCAPSILDFFSL